MKGLEDEELMTSLEVTLKDNFMGRYFLLNVDGLFVG